MKHMEWTHDGKVIVNEPFALPLAVVSVLLIVRPESYLILALQRQRT